jgi:hypothetical protein
MKTPSDPNIKLWPGIAFDFPSVYFPILGPTIIAATNAAHPPTECTTVDPAKSINVS